jgi:hypothetical protein
MSSFTPRQEIDAQYTRKRIALDSFYNADLMETGDIISASENYYRSLDELNSEYDAAIKSARRN